MMLSIIIDMELHENQKVKTRTKVTTPLTPQEKKPHPVNQKPTNPCSELAIRVAMALRLVSYESLNSSEVGLA